MDAEEAGYIDEVLIFLEAKSDHEIVEADKKPEQREHEGKMHRMWGKTRIAKKLEQQQ